MSFSLLVKGELAGLTIGDDQVPAIIAEVTGLVRAAGTIRGSAGKWVLEVSVSHSPTARRAFRLMKAGMGVHCDIMVRNRRSPRALTDYVLRVPPERSAEVLEVLGVVVKGRYEQSPAAGTMLSGSFERRAYLRGTFLGSGSVANPEKDHHLELRFGTEASALLLQEVLMKEDITVGLRGRNGGWLVYLKECEDIVSFLALTGSHGAVLQYQNVRVFKDVKGRVNRVVNCETANVSKIVEAGFRQAQEIYRIHRVLGLDSLSPGLKELAELRLKNPDLSLTELGLLLNPRIGKSGVNHRLRRLSRLAADLEAKGR